MLEMLAHLACDTKGVTELCLATSELAIHFSNRAGLYATCKASLLQHTQAS